MLFSRVYSFLLRDQIFRFESIHQKFITGNIFSKEYIYPVLDMLLNLVSQIVFFFSLSLFRRTQDCVNGTLLKEIPLPQSTINFTSFLNIYEKSLQYPVDPTNIYVPAQRSLTIYNSSRLYINFEGCVNTLKGECKDFLATHGRDGDNQTAQSRYPCYYNKVSQFFFQFHVSLFLSSKSEKKVLF